MTTENTGEVEGTQDSAFLAMVREKNAARAGELQGDNDGRQGQEETPKEVTGERTEGLGNQAQEEGQEEEKLGILEDPLAGKDLKPKKPTKDENIKNLRSSLNNERTRIQELEAQLEEARKATENPELPEEIQNQIKEKDERLSQLEHYEKLFGLYNTDGFKETYYDSVDALSDRAKEIAKDYDVDGSVIDEAMGLSNRKQLIETLGQYFDIHTAGEIRDIVLEARSIVSERERAEKNPEEVRTQLLSLVGRNKEQRIQKARDNMQGAVSTGWTRMLESYSDPRSGFEPLQEKPGNIEHMKNRDAILQSAEKDLGAVMGIFAQNGLSTISDSVAGALAARFQLSSAAGILHNKLKAAESRIAELEGTVKKNTKYSRPLTQGSESGSSIRPNEGDAPSGKDLAAHVFEKAREKMGQ